MADSQWAQVLVELNQEGIAKRDHLYLDDNLRIPSPVAIL